jgi:hypothetical protein
MKKVTAVRSEKGSEIFVGDRRLPICFTPETTDDEVNRFLVQARPYGNTLYDMVGRYEERLEWNFQNMGKGKDWPIFRELDRLLKMLQKDAGVEDT